MLWFFTQGQAESLGAQSIVSYNSRYVNIQTHVRYLAHSELLVPRARSALKQRRAFSVIGMNSLLRCACCHGTMFLPSASFLRHFSLAVSELRAPLSLSRFLEQALYKYPE